MKTIKKVTLLMAVALLSVFAYSCNKESKSETEETKSNEVIENFVDLLKSNKDFANVEFDGKNVTITMLSDDPELETVLAENDKEMFSSELKDGFLGSLDYSNEEVANVLDELVKENVGIKIDLKCGNETVSAVVTPDNLKTRMN